jgi:hypothetical protein
MNAKILHPAYLVIERSERAWTDDPKQAAERAMIIMERLERSGILTVHIEVKETA